MSPPDNGTLRRGASAKFKKKKSIGNIQALKVSSTDISVFKEPQAWKNRPLSKI